MIICYGIGVLQTEVSFINVCSEEVLSKDLLARIIKQERQNPLEIDTQKIKNKIESSILQKDKI